MSDSNAQMKGVGIDLSPMDNILWKGKFIDRAGSMKTFKRKRGLLFKFAQGSRFERWASLNNQNICTLTG